MLLFVMGINMGENIVANMNVNMGVCVDMSSKNCMCACKHRHRVGCRNHGYGLES